MILVSLFISFVIIGAFSFGGGYAALPLIQNQIVSLHHWLSPDEFNHLITISQMTPGPIAINAVIALIATAGLAMLIPVIFQDSALRLDAVRIEGIALFLGCLWLLRKKRCSPILVMVLAGALQAGLYALQQLV